jgi:glycyl-tRNA synthetase
VENVAAAAALEDQLATSGSAVVNVNGKDFTLERGMVSYTLSPKTVTVESFVPHVVEPSFGIGRIMTGILEHCFSVRPGAEERRVLSFPAVVAPVKCSLLPLDGRVSDAAVAMVAAVLDEHNISYVLDDSGTSIGKRYARTDEIGIPFALTVEISTPETGTVTLRDRDSCAQVVVPVAEVGLLITSLCSGRASWTDMTARYTNLEASEKASAVGGGAGGAESSTPAAASKDSAVVVEGRDRMYGRFSRPKVSIL